MIYDIKVFDKHGNLKEVVNGHKDFQKIYGSSEAPKASVKGHFICKYCGITVEQTRTSKITCGSRKCRNEHARSYKKKKGARKITCRICKTKLEVTQSRQITCSKECSEENNRRTSLAGARRRQEYSGMWDRKRRELECKK
jgi:hypothetical protein